jgi:hypothetical protein
VASTGPRARTRHPQVPAPAALVVALLAFGRPGAAHAEPWHASPGVQLRAMFGAGDFARLASPALGFDLDLDLTHGDGGPGARAVLGMQALESETIRTSGSLLWSQINGAYRASQTLGWFAAGPSWTWRRGRARAELYALGGPAWVNISGEGLVVNVSGEEPPSSSTWTALAGLRWSTPLGRPDAGVTFEVGAELQAGGDAHFWDRPALEPDGSGGGTYRTTTATIRGGAVRIGLNFGRGSGKRS